MHNTVSGAKELTIIDYVAPGQRLTAPVIIFIAVTLFIGRNGTRTRDCGIIRCPF